MNVFFLSDDKFAEIFAVALESLCFQQQHTEELRVFLVENGVSAESKSKIDSIADRYGRHVEYIAMPDILKRMGSDVYIPDRLNVVDYARLFAAEILPADIDKVIQLDCDLIVRHPLDEMWEMDLNGCYCRMINEGHNKPARRSLHIPGEGMYFNCGVVLIDLKKWREDAVQDKFIAYVQKMNGYVPVNAQGVINAVMDGEIGLLPLKYNVHSLMYAFSYEEYQKLRKPQFYYTKEEHEAALKDPYVVHFTGCFYFLDIRPWIKGCTHVMTGEYLEYRSKTPYGGLPLWDPPPKPIRHLYGKICHIVPKPVAVGLSSFIYSYVFPVKNFIMERKFRKMQQAARR